jgi:DnaK suppressor protein
MLAKATPPKRKSKKRSVAKKSTTAHKKTTKTGKRKPVTRGRKPATRGRKPATRGRKPGSKKKTTVKRKTKAGMAKKRKTTVAKKRKPSTAKRKPGSTAKRKPKITRKKTAAKGTAARSKKVTRRKAKRTVTVKKKPSKSKASQKTAKSAEAKVIAKDTLKKMAVKSVTAAKVTQKTVRKKRKQTKSDSQALPVVEQKPSLENNMAELKKSKKQTEKKAPFSEPRQDSITANTAVDLNIAPYRERPGEDYMSSNQQAHFRRLLLERKRMLLEDMGRTMHHLQDEGASLPDISDRATQEEEFNLELRARDREHKLIKKIEGALQQLDEGHYGFCNSCGVEIGIRRLEARPTATLCIDCKTLDEIREKQMGG